MKSAAVFIRFQIELAEGSIPWDNENNTCTVWPLTSTYTLFIFLCSFGFAPHYDITEKRWRQGVLNGVGRARNRPAVNTRLKPITSNDDTFHSPLPCVGNCHFPWTHRQHWRTGLPPIVSMDNCPFCANNNKGSIVDFRKVNVLFKQRLLYYGKFISESRCHGSIGTY